MSQQIPTAMVKQYHDSVEMLVQQEGSRLRGTVRNESQSSEEQFWEQIGPTAALTIANRHGDSPQVDTPHDRRRVTQEFFDWGDFVDKIDKVRILIDPTGAYSKNAAYALGRRCDEIILAAMFGSAGTGKDGTTVVNFPAGNIVALNFGGSNVGLTVAKLVEGRRLMKRANVDLRMEELHIAVASSQEADLLNTTEVTSADYNSVKALVRGDVDSFLGITFEPTELVPLLPASTNRAVPLYCKSGLLFAQNPDITTNIVQRWDKRGSIYVYAMMGAGAVRMQEPKIIQINCVDV
jgi:hypothetical protein